MDKSLPSTISGRPRNLALDGFRALAVLAVIAFHYLSDLAVRQTPEVRYYPFGTEYSKVPFLPHGNMGVHLFFMISGFVIALTLRNSSGIKDFAFKRFARLFPAMIFCSLLTYGVLSMLPLKTWTIEPIDFLPGWTFVSEWTWSSIIGRPVGLVDTVYWTLFIEAKFYVLAALCYFGLKRLPLFGALGILMVLEVAISQLIHDTATLEQFKTFTLYNFMPLFVAGSAFHALSENRRDGAALMLTAASFVLLLLWTKFNIELMLLTTLCYLMFAGLVNAPRSVAAFTWRPLVAVGAWSYALYLLHNRIGLALMYNIGSVSPEWVRHSLLIPIATTCLLTFVSMLIFRFWEAPARSLIRMATKRWVASVATGRSPRLDVS